MTAAKQLLAEYKAEYEINEKKLRKLTRKLGNAEHYWDSYTARQAKYAYDKYCEHALFCEGAIVALEEVIERDSTGTSNRD